MSDRLSRKEIKRDQFAERVEQFTEYVYGNLNTILWIAGGVAAAVLIAVGVSFWLDLREAAAQDALRTARQVFQAPVNDAQAQPDDPDTPTFADEASRQARAKELFEEVREDYGGSDAGRVATLYLARIAAEEDNLERARELWREVADDGDHADSTEARLNLIHLDRAQGNTEAVVGDLEAMLDADDAALPADMVLFELAKTYENVGREDEALDAYQRIVEEFPESAYTREAQQRAALLGGEGVPASPFSFG